MYDSLNMYFLENFFIDIMRVEYDFFKGWLSYLYLGIDNLLMLNGCFFFFLIDDGLFDDGYSD